MYHSVVRRVYVALDVLVGAPEPGGSGDGGFGRRAGGGVKAETFLQWHLLPQSDFFFFLFWLQSEVLSVIFPLWISLAFHYTKTLTSPSVSINGALGDAFLPFNNGLAFTKKEL